MALLESVTVCGISTAKPHIDGGDFTMAGNRGNKKIAVFIGFEGLGLPAPGELGNEILVLGSRLSVVSFVPFREDFH